MDSTIITIQLLTPAGVKVSGNLLEGSKAQPLADALVKALSVKGGARITWIPNAEYTHVEKRRKRTRRTKGAE